MEEIPFLSQKFTKPETTQQPNNHRSSSARGASAKHHHPDPPASGQVVFRLLCHVHTAGGVIGNSSSIIKHLETLTGSKIRLEEGLPNCHERVINIVGDASVEKKISVGGGEEEEMADVSKAQEGLIRVFERVLEVEGNSGNDENEDKNDVHRNGFIRCCRLLASKCRIGAVMGKRGKIVDGIRKSSGAKIRVLKEEIPACASPEEELIQIMGGVMAVKKALLAVSHRLQDRTFGEEARAHMSSHKLPHKLQADLISNNSPTLSGNVEKMLNLDENSSMRKVVFRFLCSNAIAGGVIGNSGSIINHLETLTGSKIRFEEGLPNCHERVINIVGDASVKKKISLGGGEEEEMADVSKAQEGLIRVFERVLKVEGNSGNDENEDKDDVHRNGFIGCRLLASKCRIGAVMGKRGKILDGIRKSSGAKIRVSKEEIPACANPEEELIQIMGGVMAVKKALLAVSHRLQDRTFGEEARAHMSSHKLPHKLQADLISNNSPNPPSLLGSAVEHRCAGHTLSGNVERMLNLDENSSMRKVVFRFLCSNAIAGGVIGNSGSIINHLEILTGSKIRFEEGLPNCHERVINIVGDASVEKKISLGVGEEVEMADVSKAQEGLIRVFERVLKVGGNFGNDENEDKDDVHRNGFIGCRLLASKCRIGAVMGKRGKILDGIRKSSGAKIRVSKEEIPACANPEEELIQIMGGVMAVKKALLAVSHRLQDRTFGEEARTHMSSHKLAHKLQADLISNNSPNPPSLLGSAVEHRCAGHTLSGNVERMLNLDENSSMRKVLFRFLCSNAIAGGVIGNSGSIINRLETLTGSKIRFEKGLPNCHERVINIVGDASVEKKISLGVGEEEEMADVSKAQEGLIRVFEMVLKVEGNSGNDENEDKDDVHHNGFIGCRLLASKCRIGAVMGKRGKILDGIRKSSGAKIRVSKEEIPACAYPDEELIQIMGGVMAVKKALLAVSHRLQDRTFGEEARAHMSSHKLPHELQADLISNNSPNPPSLLGSAVEHHCAGHTLSGNVERMLNLDENSSMRKVVFRFLCSNAIAGGVIGNSGSIINHLETLTGSKIWFEEGLPHCHERVINIVGDASVEKKISLGGGEEEEMADVSKAQDGLIRVFERVLKVEGNYGNDENEDKDDVHRNGFIGCRLLASKCRIGAVMGKKGKILDGIRKSSGAKIRVSKEEIPACANSGEELIQIMGGVMAVKNALLAVSHRLQDRTFGEEAHMSSHKLPHKLKADLISNNIPCRPSFLGSAVEHHCVGPTLSGNVERMLNLDENSSMRKVVFRFLCSNAIAGGVIGKSAIKVTSVERETRASIKFASPVSGSKERVAIISSLESPDPLYSPAQIAIIRVFGISIEVGIDQGVVSSLGNGKSATARILVGSHQVGCLQDEGGRVASEISIASGVGIQLMGVNLLPKCAGADDDVVQITGEYENVKSALFQVTGKLRERFFSRPGPESPDRHCSSPAIPSSIPNGREAASSTQLSRLPYTDQLDHLGFVQKSSSPDSAVLQWDQADSRGSTTIPVDSAQGSTTFTCGLKPESFNGFCSNVGNDLPKQTVEVVVPREVFGSVYGENGSNVARLKEISGATVLLQDPCPG